MYMSQSEIRIKELDSLRGIASLGVALVWHYSHFQAESFPIQNLSWLQEHGWILVDFFFTLSGFVFMHVYSARIINHNITFEKYLVFRIARLYPIHLITLFVAAIGHYFYFKWYGAHFMYAHNDVFHFILNILFLQGGMLETSYSFNGPSWSIAIEVIGYILFFYVLHRFGKTRQQYILSFIFFILIGLMLQKQGVKIVFFNQLTARLFVGFFVGCILYNLNFILQNSRFKILVLSIIFVMLAFFIHLYNHAGPIMVGHANNYTLFVFPAIIILCLHLPPLKFLLSIRPLTFLGNISFSVYLWHFPIQLFIKNIDPRFQLNIDYSSKIFFLLYALAIIMASVISYFMLELPIQAYIRKRYQERKDK